jgi:uncharacterized LabA/DUF88 family protein
MTTDDPEEEVDRVVVFIDEANVFNDALRAFGFHDAAIPGRIEPVRYGNLLIGREPPHAERKRVLHQVRVYCGRPNPSHDPKSYAAHRRQVAHWKRDGAKVIARDLRYGSNWPNERPQQKGVDVQLAIDMVTMAIREEYDVGILASCDTDLRPAIEACALLPAGGPVIEVCAWQGTGYASRLRVKGMDVWCHYLERGDYLTVADYKDYTA